MLSRLLSFCKSKIIAPTVPQRLVTDYTRDLEVNDEPVKPSKKEKESGLTCARRVLPSANATKELPGELGDLDPKSLTTKPTRPRTKRVESIKQNTKHCLVC